MGAASVTAQDVTRNVVESSQSGIHMKSLVTNTNNLVPIRNIRFFDIDVSDSRSKLVNDNAAELEFTTPIGSAARTTLCFTVRNAKLLI